MGGPEESLPSTEERTVKPARFAPVRLSAIALALCVVFIVWMSYSYTSDAISEGLKLLASHNAAEIKDGVIQLLTAVVQNMVALTAVGGLAGPINKLCES